MIANELSNEQGHIESASGLLVDLMPDGVEAAKRIRMLPGMNAHLAKHIDIDRLVQTIADVMKV